MCLAETMQNVYEYDIKHTRVRALGYRKASL